MKKIKSLFIGIFAIAAVLLLTGCTNKTAISEADFKSKMEEKNFVVQDATYQFENYEYVKKALLAQKEDYSYQIEFYILDTITNAESFFETNKDIFEESKSNGSTETSVSLGNNDKYTLSTDGQYKLISRIDNTMIYLNVAEDNREEVKELVEELGY